MGERLAVESMGLNVQEPWASLLVSGRKVVETRTYPCPAKYLGKPVFLVATKRSEPPGTAIIGRIKIVRSFEYLSEAQFRCDEQRHLIAPGLLRFDFAQGVPKWGWEIEVLEEFENPIPKKGFGGIVWTKVTIDGESD